MSFLLLKSIEQLLSEGFANKKFRQKDLSSGSHTSPGFYIGALTHHQDFEKSDYFPFIINRFVRGSETTDKSLYTVRTICGIYTDQFVEDGENDIANMIFTAKQIIMTDRILGAYTLYLPLKWSLGGLPMKGSIFHNDENQGQNHPYYAGQIETTWQTPAVEQDLEIEDLLSTYSAGYR
ncbi:MAG: hypothetical protein GY874_07995 [Desulfobacteraceae bacterium]|nr:hypothetical protein [Desulfobacteraceae bacterium]